MGETQYGASIEMLTKNQNTILLFVLGTTAIGAFVSLFFPYLHKFNLVSGDLSIPRIVKGIDFLTAKTTGLLLFFTWLHASKYKQYWWLLFWSSLAALFTNFTRHSIHFQTFIDHDYDSAAGFGFYLLFICSLINISTCLVFFVLSLKQDTSHSS